MNLKTGGTMKRIQFLSFILVCVLLCSTVFNTVSLAASTLDTVEHESDYECEEEKKAITISQNQTLEYGISYNYYYEFSGGSRVYFSVAE